MFNFQKEVVINSADQFKAIAQDNAGKDGKSPVAASLDIHDGGRYYKKYLVGKIFKTEAREGKNAKITFDASKIVAAAEGKHVQILVELGLDRDYRGDYGSALWYFRKPILVDVNVEGLTNESLAKAFMAAVPAEYKFVTVDAKNCVLEAEDCYIKVRNIVVTDFVCAESCGDAPYDEPKVLGELAKGTLGEMATVEDNVVEFGTYNYLIQNLRLPTYENLRFKSPASVEMPIMGAKYIQYSFAYCVPRVGLGGMSAASQMIHSTTMHTFFVLDSEDVSDAFESALNEVFEGALDKDAFKPDAGHEHNIELLADAGVVAADVQA